LGLERRKRVSDLPVKKSADNVEGVVAETQGVLLEKL
jgi:hypothetical protein